MSLGAIEGRIGNYNEELRYFKEASKTTNTPTLIVEVSRGTAIVRAKEGDHKQAVKEFERIFPLIKHAAPISYYQYLNSFAVELAEIGRLEEARKICDVILASPYAFAYPEWRETREDIERKGYRSSRSFIPIIQGAIQHNVVPLPLSSSQETYARSPFQPPAIVRSIDEWKKMPKKKNGDKKDDFALPANPTERDVFFRIMHLASRDGLSEKKLWKMLEAVERISEEPEE